MHLDEETLAQWALDDVAPDPAAAEHLLTCQTCQEKLAELRELVDLSHDLPHLEAPPPEVWERITTELGRTSQPAVRAGRRTVLLAASIAAILGLGLGVAGTKLLDRQDDDAASQAVIKLDPLQGKSGDGTADLVRVGTGAELRVSTTGLPSPSGFYEVWLINQDGKRMVSLGVLDPRTDGTYLIPPDLTAQGYRIVDVSLEPNDGNPEHSHDSIIRGTLPA
ncbi:anti-sigma factor [Kribbella sp. NBC_00382]|uniref:anti-sigma factor n=1 Tax=Kribbella sp. NBC_00382 TaxID=2975967 RepID=UPI002E237047